MATARDPGFRDRVLMAAVNAAVQISAEPYHDPVADPEHAPYWSLRHALATAVLNDPAGYVDRFSWAVAQNPGVSGPAATDNDIEYTVQQQVWDGIAGAATQLHP